LLNDVIITMTVTESTLAH